MPAQFPSPVLQSEHYSYTLVQDNYRTQAVRSETMSMPRFRTAVVRARVDPARSGSSTFPSSCPGPGEVRSRSLLWFHAMRLSGQPEYIGLGWDFAGTAVATGHGVDLAVGIRVAGLVGIAHHRSGRSRAAGSTGLQGHFVHRQTVPKREIHSDKWIAS